MAATKSVTTNRDLASELVFLTRALKAPTLRDSAARLAERARAESWSHEEYLAPACNARSPPATRTAERSRIRAARFPARKSIEEFDFDHARGLKRDLIAHLGTLDFVAGKENVIFLGPPGTGKTHLRDRARNPGLPGRASGAVRHRQPMGRPARRRPHRRWLQAELIRLARYPLLVVDEVGYIPFEPEAANLFFQLVSSRYERASLIVTSNKAFGRGAKCSATKLSPPP
jgi:DNA replication protein DnaC